MSYSFSCFVEKRRADGKWEPIAPLRESCITETHRGVLCWGRDRSDWILWDALTGLHYDYSKNWDERPEVIHPIGVAKTYEDDSDLYGLACEKYPHRGGSLWSEFWFNYLAREHYPFMEHQYHPDRHTYYQYLTLKELQDYQYWDQIEVGTALMEELSILGKLDEIRFVFGIG